MINLIDISIDNIDFSYKSFSIPKRNGGKRTILAPSESLKEVQKELKKRIENSENNKLPNYITGFRKGLSIKDNASFHVNKDLLINIDIKNFFGSITEDKIRKYFDNKVDDINKFIKLTTYNGVLSTGAPSSPIIGNLIFLEIDDKIYSYLERKYKAFNYTRYVDDITISFNENINIKKLLEEIKFKLEYNNFFLNEDKIRIQNNKVQQVVTGLVVNKKVSYPRFNYRILRSKIHKYIVEGIGYFPEIKGYLNYLNSVNTEKYLILKNYYSKFKDNKNYIDLFIGTTRPIITKNFYYGGKRQSKRGHCKIYEEIDISYDIKKYKI